MLGVLLDAVGVVKIFLSSTNNVLTPRVQIYQRSQIIEFATLILLTVEVFTSVG